MTQSELMIHKPSFELNMTWLALDNCRPDIYSLLFGHTGTRDILREIPIVIIRCRCTPVIVVWYFCLLDSGQAECLGVIVTWQD